MVWRNTKRILVGLAIVVIAGLCSAAVWLKTNDGALLSVQSDSMSPAINQGDLVVANRVSERQITVGDVVTFTNPANKSQTITHRVAAIDHGKHQMQTKGDANQLIDGTISTRSVVGEVQMRIPYLGRLVDFVRRPLGLILIIYVPALVVVAGELRRLQAHYRAQQIFKASKKLALNGGSHLNDHSKGLALTVKVAVGIVVVALGISPLALASLSTTATLSGNSISTVGSTPSQTVCMFPEHEVLLSYARIDVLFPEEEDPPIALTETIQPGNYKITAVSYDNHTGRPNSPDQLNERWFAMLYGEDSSKPAYETGVTDDIPYENNETTTVLNESLEITEPITGIRYAHNALNTGLEKDNFDGRTFDQLTEPEKRQVIWNSVHPGCITFERLQAVSPLGLPE